MWQGYGSNYQNNNILSTTINPNPNASIDYVVSQVEKLANGINVLTNDGESAGLQIADRGVQTWNRMSSAFQNGTIQNVENIIKIVNEKTHNWPITELIVIVIVGIILVLITLIFLFMVFGERVTVYRQRQKLAANIENI